MQTNYELLSDARRYLRELVEGGSSHSKLVDSWDEFFSLYDSIIRRFAISGGVPRDEVDECVQEVWTAVVAHLERFQPDPNRGRFRTWLYQIVRNKATDLVRRKQKAVAVSLNDSRFEFDVPDEDDVSSQDLDEIWQKETLRALLADLKRQISPVHFELFEQRAVYGKTFEELSDRFQMKPSALRTRYHRTLKQFRSLRRRHTDLFE